MEIPIIQVKDDEQKGEEMGYKKVFRYSTGNAVVDEVGTMNFIGNIIPMVWFKTICYPNGAPHNNAIHILADIVYWYRPKEERDEESGQLIGMKKKFKDDYLQRSYAQMAETFGLSKRQVNPDLFMASTTQELTATIHANSSSKILPLVASVGITLIFAGIASFPAARYASCVSPTVAMSGQSAKVKRRHRKAKKIRNFEAFYARLNLKRNRGRTAITILSMVMSITVFVALQSFSGLLDASAALKDSHLGDYSVTNETMGIAAASVNELRENKMVDSLSTTMLIIYQFDESGTMPVDTDIPLQTWEALHIAAFDDERLTSAISILSENDKVDLLNGTACLVKNPIPFSVAGQEIENTELSVNDEIQVENQTLRVAGIVDEPVTINNEGFVNGVQIIVCDAAYTTITGQEEYAEVYPALTGDADTEQFETWLDEWCSRNTGSHWLSYLQSDAELAESFAQINMLCWGLILFIGFIGVLNIINTVYTNIHTRVSEIGMQRAIGMSKTSLYKTFLWEGAYYGLIASVFGGLLGYICAAFIEAAVNNTLQFGTVPIISILEAAAVSVIACLIATAIPLRSIARTDIVKSIVMIVVVKLFCNTCD